MQGYSESEGISYQTSILKIKKGLGESLKMWGLKVKSYPQSIFNGNNFFKICLGK